MEQIQQKSWTRQILPGISSINPSKTSSRTMLPGCGCCFYERAVRTDVSIDAWRTKLLGGDKVISCFVYCLRGLLQQPFLSILIAVTDLPTKRALRGTWARLPLILRWRSILNKWRTGGYMVTFPKFPNYSMGRMMQLYMKSTWRMIERFHTTLKEFCGNT